MKMTKIALFVLLTLGILAATYFVGHHIGKRDGYSAGMRDDSRHYLGEILNKDIFLYSKAESGDLAGVKGILVKYISGESQYFEQHFGEDRSVHLGAAHEIINGAAATDKK